MQKWTGFLDLCDILKWGLFGGKPCIHRIESWIEVAEASNLHSVAPTLAHCLHGAKSVPDDFRKHHEVLRGLFLRREEAMLEALERAVGRLNKAGVVPVLLKGMAHLVDGLYPPGARFVGDADLLIEKNDAQRAYDILAASGFSALDKYLPPNHRHLPMLVADDSGLAIELHTRVEQDSPPVFPLRWFLAGAHDVAFRSTRVRLFDPTRMVAMNFAHARVNDGGRPSPVELRWLIDLVLMVRKYGDGIDWKEVHRYCAKNSYGDALATYLMFAERLLDHEMPKPAGRPDHGAIKVLREYIDPSLSQLGRDDELISYEFLGDAAVREAGHCWRLTLPDIFVNGDPYFLARTSRLELFQGDRQLGPAYSRFPVIREIGGGAYCHKENVLYFSTLGNAKPRSIKAPFKLRSVARTSGAANQIESLDRHVDSLRGRLEEIDRDKTGLLAELAHKSGLAAALTDENQAFRITIGNMRRSIFWKLRLVLREPAVAWAALRGRLSSTFTKDSRKRP